jgi:hypothetical protein
LLAFLWGNTILYLAKTSTSAVRFSPELTSKGALGMSKPAQTRVYSLTGGLIGVFDSQSPNSFLMKRPSGTYLVNKPGSKGIAIFSLGHSDN